MSQELTDADFLRGLIAKMGFDMSIGGRTAVHECDIARLRAIAARLERPAVEGWQPIKTAPKDGTKVLLCDDREAQVVVAKYCKHVKYWMAGQHVMLEPTHWLPLPLPPVTINPAGPGGRE